MRYASIRKMDVSNGAGIGVSLFVQGCPFHCKGCFNQETWDFNGGKEWTKEVEEQFLGLVGQRFVRRVSILGGEPLCDENVGAVRDLITKIKSLYPSVDIWLFTGYNLMFAHLRLGDKVYRKLSYIKTGVYRQEEACDDNIQHGLRLATRNQEVTKIAGYDRDGPFDVTIDNKTKAVIFI